MTTRPLGLLYHSTFLDKGVSNRTKQETPDECRGFMIFLLCSYSSTGSGGGMKNAPFTGTKMQFASPGPVALPS